jgi:2-polyprenyl-6-hydroxyphenyl methylase/3-demethylubiquinone-9 3-methyltransferase
MSSIVEKEIAHFAKDSSAWWDESGPFKPLHRLNPVRLSYIKAQICSHYGLDHQSLEPFTKLSILDIGCGGGLVCEPMARMGAKITGIDADRGAIFAAKSHANAEGLKIDYLCGAAEDLGKTYDVVLALEVIEHVSDPAQFVKTVAALVKPGGIVIFSTLNRTAKSFALGIVAAEYLLQWVPEGTHSWKKFIKPSELAGYARQADLKPQNVSGLIYHPLKGAFQLSKSDLDVNYFMTLAA